MATCCCCREASGVSQFTQDCNRTRLQPETGTTPSHNRPVSGGELPRMTTLWHESPPRLHHSCGQSEIPEMLLPSKRGCFPPGRQLALSSMHPGTVVSDPCCRAERNRCPGRSVVSAKSPGWIASSRYQRDAGRTSRGTREDPELAEQAVGRKLSDSGFAADDHGRADGSCPTAETAPKWSPA